MPLPKSRSPSQWPGTARSSASAGRSLMWTVPRSWPLPDVGELAGGPAGHSSAAQVPGQFPAQSASRLHVQRQVDRLVRHPHLRTVGKGLRAADDPRSAGATTAVRAWTPPAHTARRGASPASPASVDGARLSAGRRSATHGPIAASTAVGGDLPRTPSKAPGPAPWRSSEATRPPRVLLEISSRSARLQPQRRPCQFRCRSSEARGS